jgi:MFS family permease
MLISSVLSKSESPTFHSQARGCVETNGTEGTDCCTDCLGINDFNYNIFHSITIFVGVLSPLIGFLMDKWGNSVSILITLCSVIGTALVALASCVSSSWLTVSLMFVGAAVWGVGYMPAYIARERIIGVWFKDKNLRLAFGVSAAINRIPSLFTFTLTEKLRESVGLQLTLRMATLVCVFSLACAVCASALDAHGNRKLGLTDQIKQEASHVTILDIRHAGLEFWLLLGGYSCLSSTFYTYMDNSVEFISEKFSFTQSQAAISGGFLMYIGIFASPLAGLAIVSDGFHHSRDTDSEMYFCTFMIPGILELSWPPPPPSGRIRQEQLRVRRRRLLDGAGLCAADVQ